MESRLQASSLSVAATSWTTLRRSSTVPGGPGPGRLHRPGRGTGTFPGLRRVVAGGPGAPSQYRHPSRDLPPPPRLPHAWAPAHRHHPAERDPGLGEVLERGGGARVGRGRLPVGIDCLQGCGGDRLIAASPCVRVALPKRASSLRAPVAGQRRRDPGGRRPRPRGSGCRLGTDVMAGYSVS
jgi:hypothetical protein